MNRTRKQTIIGVLDIIAGILGSIIGGVLFFLSNTGSDGLRITSILLALGAALAILGILALIGGIYALYGKTWGMALVGSICSAIFLPLIGIPAIILTALAKIEFS